MTSLKSARQILIAIVCMLGLISPSAVAQTQEPYIDLVASKVAPLLAEGHFPGAAIAVLKDGEPIHVSTHGFASLAHRAPVSPETVFELASLTKHMTALAVLDLVQQNRMSLDDELGTFIHDTPESWAGITVDHLLSHTAGLEHRFEPKFQDEFLLSYTTEQMLEAAKITPTLAPPGTDWHYSDQGYFLLGVIIEKVTGTSFEDHLKSRYFLEIGMDQTAMLDQSALIPNLAQGYIFEDGELKRGRRVWQFGLMSHFGVTSTLNDLMRWESALAKRDGNFARINSQSWELQRKFSVGESCKEWGYARGWWTVDTGERRVVHHAGYSGTAYIRDVTTGLSVIVLTNREISQGKLEPMAVAWAAINAADPVLPNEGYRCWE